MNNEKKEQKRSLKKEHVLYILIGVLFIGVTVQAVQIAKLKDVGKNSSDSIRKRTDESAQVANAKQAVSRDSWDPFEEMRRLQQDINNVFNDSFNRNLFQGSFFDRMSSGARFAPNMDMRETDDTFEIVMDIPGMDKESIQIEARDGYLTVQGVRKHEKEVEDDSKGFYRMERSYGSFARTIPLPGDVRENEITAEYEKGVLTVHVPKETVQGEDTRPVTVTVL